MCLRAVCVCPLLHKTMAAASPEGFYRGKVRQQIGETRGSLRPNGMSDPLLFHFSNIIAA